MRAAPARRRPLVRRAVRHLLDLPLAPDVVGLALARVGVRDPVAPAHIDLPPDQRGVQDWRVVKVRLRVLDIINLSCTRDQG